MKMLDNLWPMSGEIKRIQTQKISSKEMFEDDYGKMFGRQTAPVMYGSDLGYKSPRQTFITRKNPKRKKRKLK